MGVTALTSWGRDSRDTVDCILELEANWIPFSIKLHFVRVFHRSHGNESKTLTHQADEHNPLWLAKTSERGLRASLIFVPATSTTALHSSIQSIPIKVS